MYTKEEGERVTRMVQQVLFPAPSLPALVYTKTRWKEKCPNREAGCKLPTKQRQVTKLFCHAAHLYTFLCFDAC